VQVLKTKTPLLAALCAGLIVSGCHKGTQAYHTGKNAETIESYDKALDKYSKAAKADPKNPQYKLKTYQMRFEASQFHLGQGIKYLEQQQNEQALKEFQMAFEIDPSCMVCRQEMEYTQKLLTTQPQAAPQQAPAPATTPAPATIPMTPAAPTTTPRTPTSPATKPSLASAQLQLASASADNPDWMDAPPTLGPLPKDPVTLKMSADSKMVFRTIGKLAGVNVIFDPEYQQRNVNVDLVNVTIQQALNVAAVEGKAFWKPISSNIIMIMPDTSQKRKEEEEQVLQKIYLEHIQTPQELTEITTTLQQMLELRHVQAVPHDNAILVRDTPDKVLLASKLVHDSDRGRPEVVVQISVLQVRRDRARSLGIQPGGTTTLAFNPATPLGPGGAVALDKLGQISQGDFSLNVPNAVATALFSDSNTRIIQNPEVRVSDGESAKLRVGDRIPVATGSFSATTGVPVVNTQFQYVDVGVNIDLVPHVHPDHSVSMKLAVEVSSLNGQVNIGGVSQPIISQRRIEHEIRLQENEVSILGGLAERSQSKSVSGWPGLARLPLLRYLFSGEDTSNSENEVLIVIHPRLVRIRDVAKETLSAMSVGTDAEIMLRQREEVIPPIVAADAAKPAGTQSAIPSAEKQLEQEATLQLEPQKAQVKAGETLPVQVKVDNVQDLFSTALLLKYDPQVVSIEDVRHGDLLSGGTQEVAIIQRIDKEKGEARILTTRQPNTAGVNGKGILLNIMVRHITAAPASLQVLEVGARNSRQKPVTLSISQGTVTIQ
jgi:general secretion pathway protein D